MAIEVVGFIGGIITISELIWILIKHIKKVRAKYLEDVGLEDYYINQYLGIRRRRFVIKVAMDNFIVFDDDENVISIELIHDSLKKIGKNLPDQLKIRIEIRAQYEKIHSDQKRLRFEEEP